MPQILHRVPSYTAWTKLKDNAETKHEKHL